MKLEELQDELFKAYGCPILGDHFTNLFDEVFLNNHELEFNKLIKLLMPTLFESDYTFYSENFRNHLKEKFFIPTKQCDDFINRLEFYGRLYVLYTIMPFASEIMNEEIKKLRKIARAAKKLRELLPKDDDSLLILLNLLNAIETRNMNSNEVQQFITNMRGGLTALENLPAEIPKTESGKFLKLGVSSPKGNMSLKIWVSSLYHLWANFLERDFDFDGINGHNGRTRFIEFVHESLLPIHQGIEFETVKNAVRRFDEIRKTDGVGLLAQ